MLPNIHRRLLFRQQSERNEFDTGYSNHILRYYVRIKEIIKIQKKNVHVCTV